MSERLKYGLKIVKKLTESAQPIVNKIGDGIDYLDTKTDAAINAGQQKDATDLEKGASIVLATGKGMIPSPKARTELVKYVQSKCVEYYNDYQEVFGNNDDQTAGKIDATHDEM